MAANRRPVRTQRSQRERLHQRRALLHLLHLHWRHCQHRAPPRARLPDGKSGRPRGIPQHPSVPIWPPTPGHAVERRPILRQSSAIWPTFSPHHIYGSRWCLRMGHPSPRRPQHISLRGRLHHSWKTPLQWMQLVAHHTITVLRRSGRSNSPRKVRRPLYGAHCTWHWIRLRAHATPPPGWQTDQACPVTSTMASPQIMHQKRAPVLIGLPPARRKGHKAGQSIRTPCDQTIQNQEAHRRPLAGQRRLPLRYRVVVPNGPVMERRLYPRPRSRRLARRWNNLRRIWLLGLWCLPWSGVVPSTVGPSGCPLRHLHKGITANSNGCSHMGQQMAGLDDPRQLRQYGSRAHDRFPLL